MDQVIPLDATPNQSILATLQIDSGNLTLQLDLHYNEVADCWLMRISDRLGAPLVDSIPLLTGDAPAANILEQYKYLQIGSAYVVNVSNTALDHPDAQTLGSDFLLVWSDTPEV